MLSSDLPEDTNFLFTKLGTIGELLMNCILDRLKLFLGFLDVHFLHSVINEELRLTNNVRRYSTSSLTEDASAVPTLHPRPSSLY